MSHLGRAISKTIKYSDYFNFPVSSQDIHYWLISSKEVSLERVIQHIKKILTPKEKRYRLDLRKNSTRKIKSIKNELEFFRKIPFIKLVVVTGSVAVNNSHPEDDIDLMIVTQNNSLWFTRMIVTAYLAFVGRKRHPHSSYADANNTLCVNLWLEERSLSIPKEKRNLYTAHEVLQVLPVLEKSDYYQQFILKNSWTKKHLANAYHLRCIEVSKVYITNRKTILNILVYPLNMLFYILQYIYMKPKITTESITLSSAYFHKINFNKKINQYLKLN